VPKPMLSAGHLASTVRRVWPYVCGRTGLPAGGCAMEPIPAPGAGHDAQGQWSDYFDRYGRKLMVLISRRMSPVLARHASPDDVLQETFLRAWERRSHLTRTEDNGAFRFFWTIAHFVLKQWTRKAALRSARSLSPDGSGLSSSRDQAEAWLVASVTRASVRLMRDKCLQRMIAILQSLDPADADLILMHHYDALSHEEVGMRLGIREDAARKRLQRARERMARVREELDARDGRVLLPHELDT
jgi:RNA polymerase sigma factor (sigma-70 family)